MAYKDNETMRKQNIKYLNTESGFIISKWNDIKKRVNKKNKMKESDGDYRKSAGSKKIAKLEHTLTKEEFLQAWEEHKIKYGWNCYYTGKPMKIGRKLAVKGAKKDTQHHQIYYLLIALILMLDTQKTILYFAVGTLTI